MHCSCTYLHTMCVCVVVAGYVCISTHRCLLPHVRPLCSVETSMHVFTTNTHICSSHQCVYWYRSNMKSIYGALLCVGIMMALISVEANLESC